MIKAVIMDMDGVIIDSELIYLQYNLEFARQKNPKVQLKDLFGMVGATKQDSWMVMERAVKNGQTWEELRQEYRKRDIYSMVDYKAIFRPEIAVVLKELKKKGYKLALASSTHMEIIMKVVTENNIKEYFDTLVSGEQFVRSKPDPEIYHYTAGILGVSEDECLVLEDSTIGITAASRSGMKVAALIDDRFGFDRSLADYELKKVDEILDIVCL